LSARHDAPIKPSKHPQTKQPTKIKTGCAHLARLDLSDNPLTAEAAPALAEALAAAPALTALNLNDTCLTDEGITLICGALAKPGAAPKLRELELALNEVTPEGAAAVAGALAGKTALVK
jgi:large subunit ribosomal protein L31/Ran GTPase-activating protein 1